MHRFLGTDHGTLNLVSIRPALCVVSGACFTIALCASEVTLVAFFSDAPPGRLALFEL